MSASAASTSPTSADDAAEAAARVAARSRSGGRRRTVTIWVARIVLLAFSLAIWQFLVTSRLANALFFSEPSAIVAFLAQAVPSGELTEHTGITIVETVWGFVIGSAFGILSGLIFARFSTLDAIFDPFLNVLNALPRVALAPLFILWFGIDQPSKIALAVSLVYFILLVNTRAGVKTVPEEYVIIARSLGAGERDLFTKVILPGAVPAIFAGLRLAAVYSLLGVVVGEMIAAKAGLGQQLTYYAGTFNTAGVFGVLIILAVIAAVLNAGMVFMEGRLLRWQHRNQ